MSPLVRLIRRPRSPFCRQTRCRSVRLQIGRVDNSRLALGTRGGQPFHDLGEGTHLPPSASNGCRASFAACICCLGASRQRSPLRFTKTIPLNTRRSFTRGLPQLFGKYGSSRDICSSVNQYGSLNPISSRRLNHIKSLISIGSSPRALIPCALTCPGESPRWTTFSLVLLSPQLRFAEFFWIVDRWQKSDDNLTLQLQILQTLNCSLRRIIN